MERQPSPLYLKVRPVACLPVITRANPASAQSRGHYMYMNFIETQAWLFFIRCQSLHHFLRFLGLRNFCKNIYYFVYREPNQLCPDTADALNSFANTYHTHMCAIRHSTCMPKSRILGKCRLRRLYMGCLYSSFCFGVSLSENNLRSFLRANRLS